MQPTVDATVCGQHADVMERTEKLPLSPLTFLLVFRKTILTRLSNIKKVLRFENGAKGVRLTDLGSEFFH